MKSSIIPFLASRSGSVGISLTILSVALSGGFAIAQPTPGKTKAREKTSGKTPEKTPTASSKPLPTPETKIDAKTEAELLQAEDRFVIAIQNRDANALSELLTDYYADSRGEDERAVTKHGSIERARAGKLPVYRIAKERKLIRSGDTFTVEGLAEDARPVRSEETRKEEWVHVRRLWLRQGNRWLAIAQMITPDEESATEKKEKEPK